MVDRDLKRRHYGSSCAWAAVRATKGSNSLKPRIARHELPKVKPERSNERAYVSMKCLAQVRLMNASGVQETLDFQIPGISRIGRRIQRSV
jgi:hypothetical protein